MFAKDDKEGELVEVLVGVQVGIGLAMLEQKLLPDLPSFVATTLGSKYN